MREGGLGGATDRTEGARDKTDRTCYALGTIGNWEFQQTTKATGKEKRYKRKAIGKESCSVASEVNNVFTCSRGGRSLALLRRCWGLWGWQRLLLLLLLLWCWRRRSCAHNCGSWLLLLLLLQRHQHIAKLPLGGGHVGGRGAGSGPLAPAAWRPWCWLVLLRRRRLLLLLRRRRRRRRRRLLLLWLLFPGPLPPLLVITTGAAPLARAAREAVPAWPRLVAAAAGATESTHPALLAARLKLGGAWLRCHLLLLLRLAAQLCGAVALLVVALLGSIVPRPLVLVLLRRRQAMAVVAAGGARIGGHLALRAAGQWLLRCIRGSFTLRLPLFRRRRLPLGRLPRRLSLLRHLSSPPSRL